MDLGVIATKEYSTFPKAPALLAPHHGFMPYPGHLLGGGYLSAEMQSVYSTASADRAAVYVEEYIIVLK